MRNFAPISSSRELVQASPADLLKERRNGRTVPARRLASSKTVASPVAVTGPRRCHRWTNPANAVATTARRRGLRGHSKQEVGKLRSCGRRGRADAVMRWAGSRSATSSSSSAIGSRCLMVCRRPGPSLKGDAFDATVTRRRGKVEKMSRAAFSPAAVHKPVEKSLLDDDIPCATRAVLRCRKMRQQGKLSLQNSPAVTI